MNRLERITLVLAKASNGNPVISTATVMLFYVMFNILEAGIEKLLFGERFEHWLDPVFTPAFIAYSAYATWWCAIFNVSKETRTSPSLKKGVSTKSNYIPIVETKGFTFKRII